MKSIAIVSFVVGTSRSASSLAASSLAASSLAAPRPDAVAFSSPVPAPEAPAPSLSSLYDDYRASSSSNPAAPRFSLGVRFLRHWLLSPKKGEPFHGSFIGSINRLDMHNSLLPSPYLSFSAPLGPCSAGFELSYTRFHISTRDNGGGDGAIDSDALFLLALAEFPNASPFTPYLQAGAAFAFNDFDPVDSWSAGSRREFVLDDSIGFVAACGCTCALADSFSLDLYLRYMDYDIDGKYVFRADSRPDTPFTFTTENLSAGLGCRYVF